MKSTLADFGILMCSSDEKTLNVFPYDKRDCFMKDIQFIHVVLGSAKPLLVLRCSCDERATLILRILPFVIGQKVLEKFYFLGDFC
jgi:hypothetical protein